MSERVPCKLTLSTKRTITKKQISQNWKKEYVKVQQTEVEYQGSKIFITEIRMIGPYIIEKFLPNNKHLVRKTGTDKTQVLHCMR